MAQASLKYIRLSAIPRSPILQAFFARGEEDCGDSFAVPATPRRPLDSAAVAVKREAHAYA